jgi:phenylacetate-coenzyme A ligase PaaK-like adenylate-forming protein
VPCYLGLTAADLDMYATNVARGYTAAGLSPGARRWWWASTPGPFVAGAVYYGFDKIGCSVIPVGTGNTERMVTAIQKLGATGHQLHAVLRPVPDRLVPPARHRYALPGPDQHDHGR